MDSAFAKMPLTSDTAFPVESRKDILQHEMCKLVDREDAPPRLIAVCYDSITPVTQISFDDIWAWLDSEEREDFLKHAEQGRVNKAGFQVKGIFRFICDRYKLKVGHTKDTDQWTPVEEIRLNECELTAEEFITKFTSIICDVVEKRSWDGKAICYVSGCFLGQMMVRIFQIPDKHGTDRDLVTTVDKNPFAGRIMPLGNISVLKLASELKKHI